MADLQRAKRNLNPHAEARLAMALWGKEYAAQRGGSMDFWDSRSPSQQRLCRDIVDDIFKAASLNGRAILSDDEGGGE